MLSLIRRRMLESERLPAGYQEVEYIKNLTIGQGAVLETDIKFRPKEYSYEIKYKVNDLNTINNTHILNEIQSPGSIALRLDSKNVIVHVSVIAGTGWIIWYVVSDMIDTNINKVKYEGTPTLQKTYFNDAAKGTYDKGSMLGDEATYGIRVFDNNTNEVNIYSFKVWGTLTNTPVLNLVPCVRKSDDTPGFYDLVSNEFKTIADAKTKWEAGPIPGQELPYGYKEVEWLESWNGEQYIDTGYTTLLDGDRVALWEGKAGFSSNYAGRSFVACFNNSGYPHFCEFYQSYFGNISKHVDTASVVDELYDVSAKYIGARGYEYTQVINGSEQTASLLYSMSVQEDTFYLFRINAAFKGTGIRIGRNKLTVDSVLIRDFIPVVKDNVGYMYDKVQQKLYANAGTGSFIAGPDV